MKFLLVIPIVYIFSATALSDVNQSNLTPIASPTLFHQLAGVSIFSSELLIIPILEYKIHWNAQFHPDNPFKYIIETEPYFQDKFWHFIGAATFTDLNYVVLKQLFGLDNPIILAGFSSLFFWTGMECLDALCSSGFSLLDQTANTAGAFFGILKHSYPNFPIDLRIGVHDWNRIYQLPKKGIPRKTLKNSVDDIYSYTYAEIIYRLTTTIYTGAIISKQKNPSKADRFGITIGYDIAAKISQGEKNGLFRALNFISDHLSLSLAANYFLK